METNSFPITNWSDDDRPREKLILKGRAAISDAELVAILIGSGSRIESAVELSKRILSSVDNNLNALGKLSMAQLVNFKGIGEAKAIAIIAALELGRRRRGEEAAELKKITSSKMIFEMMQPLIGELPHEEFWIIYVNNSNVILSKSQLSKGGITATLVDVRLILKHALEIGATGMVLCHNHPSGNLKASEADLKITKKIKLAAESLDITILDHIIIGEHGYLSFTDEGIL
jgi:DNA repair protein RadC